MGCQPSQVNRQGPQININILDSSFMKAENQHIRRQMQRQNIFFQYFISVDCFLEQFTKRYYNKIVTSYQCYRKLKNQFQNTGLTPNLYVILNGAKMEEPLLFNSIAIENYSQLIKHLKENAQNKIISNNNALKNSIKRNVDVKVLFKQGQKSSDQQIFTTALKKFGISYEFYNSFQMLQQSIQESQSDYIVTDYIFHKQIVQIFRNTKSKVYCYCSFQSSEIYAPEVYSVSNNYLDIANDIKNSLKLGNMGTVKCSKAYIYTTGIQDYSQIKNVLQTFGIQVRCFSNIEKVIKQTTYFFCVTVIVAESQAKNVAKFFQRNDYLDKVKILNIPKQIQPTVKGLFKLIRNVKKGYHAQKSITNSIDIIDKHYNNVKFQEIKRQLQNNDIKCFGFANLNEYIKNKKFISPFIICNFEERTLLIKYMKQLQCKSKIIIFCNKNKINNQLKDNGSYSFVSSHFGKILKFIKKTLVFLPVVDRQQQLLFKQKIEKIKSKNKRISALKWSQLQVGTNNTQVLQQNFQFLNIAKQTNQDCIRDIQKSISVIWKADCSILQFENFKNQFIKSLGQLKKIHKINFGQLQFTQLIQKIKTASISELLEKVKTFFDADNQLGLQINKSLIKTQRLEKKQITHMRQFLLLVFMNYFSGYQLPRIGKKKITHWISNSLIQKCQVGSYLFCKNFLIFYEKSTSNLTALGKYKIELQIEYNSLQQSQMFLNSFINYKDKVIFSPFSQFIIQSIQNAGQFKIITVKFIKNIDFLTFAYQNNVFKNGQNISSFVQRIINKQCSIVDKSISQQFQGNLQRIKAIQSFQIGNVTQAIQTHKKLIKLNQQKQNLDSFLINELNYQLACFYIKANMNKQAAASLKDLILSDPGEYIKQQCQKIIKQVIKIDQENKEQKGKRISQQAMKTFVWLKNKQQLSDQSGNLSEQDGQNIKQQQISRLQNGMKCMQVDDIDEIQQFHQHDLGKQNVS